MSVYFLATCPNCGNKQEAIVGRMSRQIRTASAVGAMSSLASRWHGESG